MLFSLHDQYEFQENTALLKLLAEKKYVNCKKNYFLTKK